MFTSARSHFVVARLVVSLTAGLSAATVSCLAIVMLFTQPVNGQAPDRSVPPAEQRSDSFEIKLKLLQDAWEKKDYDLARSLTHSLRDSVIRTQDEEQSPGTPLIPAADFHRVTTLPESWQRWAAGWKYFKTISVDESAGEARRSEPVEVLMSFPLDQLTSAAREVRIARQSGDRLVEVPCQVFGELRREGQRYCRILWMADSQPHEHQTYFCFYGNPDAELPRYPSDLETTGEGFGLDISNSVFKASLSRQTGQLERMTLRREHGLELFSGGEGHGEPPGIDWAHDYVDENFFQKLRISLWETCPDYEVVRGPLCTIIRRWGFPRSPIHPIDTPARLKVDVEYRFYSGLPWFQKTGSMTAVQSFRAEALRDDEWVFSGQSFTDKLWMDRDGKLKIGDVPPDSQKDIHGVGFFHNESQDSFVSLFLDHSAEGLPELAHTGSPTLYYRWHGAVWSRYPLPLKDVPAGAVLRQKNAYISIPFTKAEGPAEIERMHRCLMNPLKLTAGDSQQTFDDGQSAKSEKSATDSVAMRLARPGEAADSPVPKQEIWNALRDCKDAQLYTADINLVDLGLIRDIRVRGDVVTVVLTMPHRGRSRPDYFVDGSISVHPTRSVPIRERLMQIAGVRQVVVEHSWDPRWSSNDLTQTGREKLRLPTLDLSH